MELVLKNKPNYENKTSKKIIERTLNDVQEECADLISSNPDLNGSAIDFIVSGLLH